MLGRKHQRSEKELLPPESTLSSVKTTKLHSTPYSFLLASYKNFGQKVSSTFATNKPHQQKWKKYPACGPRVFDIASKEWFVSLAFLLLSSLPWTRPSTIHVRCGPLVVCSYSRLLGAERGRNHENKRTNERTNKTQKETKNKNRENKQKQKVILYTKQK